MKIFIYCIFLFILIYVDGFSQYNRPKTQFNNAYIAAEMNPSIQQHAYELAIKNNQPIQIYLREGIYIEAKSIENNRVVYTVITNPLKIYQGAFTSFFEELNSKYDFSKAYLDYGNGNKIDNTGLIKNNPINKTYSGNELLVIVESQQRRVIALNPITGDLVSESFIPNQDTSRLVTPKHLLQLPDKKYIISDQIRDVVQKYDTNKTYLGVFAPNGGVNNTILDNIRGIAFKIASNNLLVTNADGARANTIREFDNNGALIGNFIDSTGSGLTSPYFIIPRNDDYIVTASGGPNRVMRFSSTGTFMNILMTSAGTTFPQQIIELANGNFAFCEFSVAGSGVKIITPTGTLVNNFTNVQGLRGIYQLASGNFLVSNATGIYEIDDTTGALIRTILSGIGIVSGQYFTKITLPQGGSSTSSIGLLTGWNLFSVPLLTSDMSVNTILPNKSSSVYSYSNGYQTVDTLRNGIGFWVKYPNSSTINIQGSLVSNKTTNTTQGWNIIGPYNTDIPINQITTNPPNNVGSLYYGFNPSSGYYQTDTLKFGLGYFVKFNQNGTFTIP